MDAVEMAQNAGYRAVISHRSGETEDAFIADLALQPVQARSKPEHPADRIEMQNTINCSGLQNSLKNRQFRRILAGKGERTAFTAARNDFF